MSQQEQELSEMNDENIDAVEELIEKPLPQKKKAKGLGFLLVCIVLFAGAFFAAQYFGEKAPGLSDIVAQNGDSVVPAAPPVATAAPAAPAPVNTVANAPVTPDPLAIEEAVPKESPAQTEILPDPLTIAAENTAPQESPPSVTVAPLPEMPPESIAATVAPVGPVVAETAAAPEQVQPLSATEEDADTKIAMPEVEVQPAVNNVLPVPVVDAAPEIVADETAGIKETLKKIEDRLTALEAQVQNGSAATPIADLQKDIETIKTSLQDLQNSARERQNAKARSAAAADVRRGYGLPKQAQKKSSSYTAAESLAQQRAQSGLSWRLRSAKPGKAWVAPVGSNEITLVQTGDTLPGLGKITAVGKDSQSGRWFVQGVLGRIEQ